VVFYFSYLLTSKWRCVTILCSPFPTVAEAVQEELEDYKTKEDEVRRLKRAMVTTAVSCPVNYSSTLLHLELVTGMQSIV